MYLGQVLGQVAQFLRYTLNLTDTAETEMGLHGYSLTSYCNTSAMQSDKVRSDPMLSLSLCVAVYSVNILWIVPSEFSEFSNIRKKHFLECVDHN